MLNKIKDFIQTKNGLRLELLLFSLMSMSFIPMIISGPLLVGIAILSLELRNTQWIEIGFSFKDFSIKKISVGIALAVFYVGLDQYVVDDLISKIAEPGLPEIFSMKGDIIKLIIGLAVSWSTAAFFEELLFRGYFMSRLIDAVGEGMWAKIIVVIISAAVFGFVHAYQGLHGAIGAGVFGIYQASVFFIDKKRVTIPIVAHGAFDTIGFTMLYLG